jgi:protocatechuate 4,5-dioxygenase beta chain
VSFCKCAFTVLTHQLDGERAGFINEKFDLMCMDKIVNEPEECAKISMHDLVKEAALRKPSSSCADHARSAHREGQKDPQQLHIAISNKATGLMVLENAA